MSAQIRFAFMAQVTELSGSGRPFMVVDCQVWNGNQHMTTVKLQHYVDIIWPEHANIDDVESYAATAARAVARAMGDVQMDAVESGGLHTRHDFQKEADGGK